MCVHWLYVPLATSLHLGLATGGHMTHRVMLVTLRVRWVTSSVHLGLPRVALLIRDVSALAPKVLSNSQLNLTDDKEKWVFPFG